MSKLAGDVLIRPMLTEKGTTLGEEDNKVVFKVAIGANKIDIKRAIEKLYEVQVESVRTLIVPGKTKRVGRSVGRKPKWKKAIIRLREGDNVDFFAV